MRNLKFPKGLVFGPMNQESVLFAVVDSNQHRKLMAGEIGAGVGEKFNDLPVDGENSDSASKSGYE